MVAPLGRRTVKGVRDWTLFKHGTVTKRKWPVQPEYTIAVSCCARRGGVRQTYTSLLVGLTASHVLGPSGLRFVAGFGGVASKACVCLTNLVATSPTLIALRWVETSWAPLVTPFLIEQSLQFPRLGGVFL
jgi:hypothetical protein